MVLNSLNFIGGQAIKKTLKLDFESRFLSIPGLLTGQLRSLSQFDPLLILLA